MRDPKDPLTLHLGDDGNIQKRLTRRRPGQITPRSGTKAPRSSKTPIGGTSSRTPRTDKTLMGLISKARGGEQAAVDRVFELVYGDLRAAAQRILGPEQHTIGATEIVNEAYLRMRAADFPDVSSRRHLVNTAAIVLQRVLIDHLRAKRRAKRGGGRAVRLPVDPASVPAIKEFGLDNFEQVHHALEELAAIAPINAEVLMLRVVLGMTIEQIAEILQISPTTTKLRWKLGIAWLRKKLND